ncbi:MAG: Maf family protein [Myxococcaceae bacterium]
MPSSPPSLVLASASPRRQALLAQLGIAFLVDPAQVNESVQPSESPRTYVLRLAQQKAEVVAARHPGSLVLGADTTVAVEGEILGKPANAQEALGMLRRLAGRTHHVHTAVATAGRRSAVCAVQTAVRFAALRPEALAWYADSGEPLDKAGGYALQGLGGFLVEAISGSHSSVIGLPLVETLGLLEAAGLVLPWGGKP